MNERRTIFKFLSVRGVETALNASNQAYFFRRESQVQEESEFMKSLKGKNRSERKGLAESYLEKEKPQLKANAAGLYDSFVAIQRLAQSGQDLDDYGDRIDQILKDSKKAIKAPLVGYLWDQLVASSIHPRAFGRDQAKHIYPLRLINLTRNQDEALESVGQFRKYLKAIPILPRGDESPKEKPEKEKPDKDPEKPPKKDDSVDRYHKVLEELKAKDRQNNRLIQNQSLKTAKRKVVRDGDLKNAREVRLEDEPRNVEQFAFLPEVAKSLSKTTLAVMEENGLSVDDRISTIQAELERVQQQNIARATQGKGVKEIIGLGGGVQVKSTQMGQVSGQVAVSAASGVTVPTGKGTVTPIGVGDLLLVEEVLTEYRMNEVAHVENIMQSEYKERVHRTFEQQEESYLFETESTQETEHDLQKAERFELQEEAQNVISTEQTSSASLSISAGYGPVSVSASGSYSISNSFEESVSKATSFAREITERSVSRIIERQLEQSSFRTLTEVEETNTHGFDNSSGSGHVIGIYRYLDKVYQAQVFNYGKRMMFEFMIPEPAALYKHALTNQQLPGMTLSMPDDEILNLSPTDISRTEYLALAKLYQAKGVKAPPPDVIYAAKSFYQDYSEEKRYTGLASDEIQVEPGYFAESFNADRVFGLVNTTDDIFRIVVGDRRYDLLGGDLRAISLNELTSTVPVVIKTSYLTNWGVTIEVKCRLTTEKYQEWQQETYEALLDAYYELKAAYEEQLASAKSAAGVGEFGQSDEMNRVTEQIELKRGCLSLLTDQHFDLFDAMTYPSGDLPEMDIAESMAEGNYVQFFEQAFEWENLSFALYPYFWGNKSKWVENMNIVNADTRFQEFLQAGFARVLVPVRPGYDNALLHYLETGELWEGGEAPAIDDELYVSILEEVYEGYEQDKEAVGESWELTVPTNLVYLQEDASLPDLEEENPS